ncbi:hypothetical protein [Streptomyces sp. PanSC19]|nr:hypothetical protein [Streptomyces sp. PanSC19]
MTGQLGGGDRERRRVGSGMEVKRTGSPFLAVPGRFPLFPVVSRR